MSISFWTPVIDNRSDKKDSFALLRSCEMYFNWGSRSAKQIHEIEDGIAYVRPSDAHKNHLTTALKIISLATVVIPLVALIGKVIYRATHTFVLKADSPPILEQLAASRTQRDSLISSISRTSSSVSQLADQAFELTTLVAQKNNGRIEALAQAEAKIAAMSTEVNALPGLRSDVVRLNNEKRALEEEVAKLKTAQANLAESIVFELGQNYDAEIEAAKQASTSRTSSPELESKNLEQSTPINHKDNFKQYVEKHCAGTDFDTAWTHVVDGAKLFANINEAENLKDEDLTKLQWFFMYYAQTKFEAFHEGTFVLNTEVAQFTKLLNSMENRYDRISSHYAGRGPAMHSGVDCSGPANKHTVLFSPIDSGRQLFIKPENHGTRTYYDILLHGFEYVESVQRRLAGGNEKEGFKKERVPAELLREFNDLVKDNTVFLEAKTYGISWMYAYAKEKNHTAFAQKLKNTYRDLEIRTGNEVIIGSDARSLATSLQETK